MMRQNKIRAKAHRAKPNYSLRMNPCVSALKQLITKLNSVLRKANQPC